MRRLITIARVAACAIVVLATGPALAQSGPPEWERRQDGPRWEPPFETWRALRDGSRRVWEGVKRDAEELWNSLPRYDAPRMTPDGDIIIPRASPRHRAPPEGLADT
ncbi:MAG TPA: hypothetical protein VEY95_14430 [Azospirillaceae bacterium]|nr:hypothetical protein [Azospirillaceae bacterium]